MPGPESLSAEKGPWTLPQGKGPCHSSLHISELVDHSRPDPFNASHVRRLMVSRFEPTPASHCKLVKVPYFPPAVAAAEDEILAPYDYPKIFSNFELEVCDSKSYRRRGNVNSFPIALFSPGLNTTRLFYSSLAQEISSHGFTVITIDHPYDVDVVQFPNGDVIYGGIVQKPEGTNSTSAEFALEVRAQDVSFVLDTLGVRTEQTVLMFGQSFGGAATATAMLKDKRIKGGVDIDGMMFGPVLKTPLGSPGYPQAFLLWGSDGHNTTTDNTWGQFWNTLEISDDIFWHKEFSIANSSHGSCWDLNILVDVAGIRGELSETAQQGVGPIPGPRVWEILGKYLSAFFWLALGLKSEDKVLQRPSRDYPEVEILRG